MNKSKKLSDIRINHYKFQKEDALNQFNIELKFTKNPYTFLRWKFNMEISIFLIYFFLRTPLSANSISLIYILLSPLGFLLMISKDQSIILIGLCIFLFKNLFDYVDGYIARYRNESSMKGHVLDTYGAFIGDICFKTAIGIFLFNKYNDTCYLYGCIVYLLSNALSINKYYKSIYFEKLNNVVSNEKNIIEKKTQETFLKKTFVFVDSIFDDRARSTDFITLLIMLNLLFNFNFIIYVFCFIVLKDIAKFITMFFLYYKN